MGRPRKNAKQKTDAKHANAANMQFLGQTQQNLEAPKSARNKEKGEESVVPLPKQHVSAKTEPLTPASNLFQQEKVDRIKSERRKKVDVATPKLTSELQAKKPSPSDNISMTETLPLNLCVVKRTAIEAQTEEMPSCSYSPNVLRIFPDIGDESATPYDPNLTAASEMTRESGEASQTCTQTCTTSSAIDPHPSTSTCSSAAELIPEQTVHSIETPAKESEDSHTKIKNLQTQVASLQKENKELRDENEKLRVLNMKLQEAILAKTVDAKFTEIEGYPDANWLLTVSQSAQDSDYVFVKELLVRLFPDGIGNATVSGRPSNNPHGRRLRGSEPTPHRVVGKLDPEKVNYIKERLYERRRILMDPIGIAQDLSKNCTKYISQAIANNPSLRRQRAP